MGVEACPRGRRAQFPAAQRTAMARSAVLWLLPLLLLLHSPNAHPWEPIRFRMSQRGSALPKQQVQLRCEVLRSESVTGCNWLFQGPDFDAVPEFLVYIGTKLVVRPGLSGVSGRKESSVAFVLTLHSFGELQQGYYFCAIISNSILHFSSKLPLFLPPRPITTLPPSTPTPETCRPAPQPVCKCPSPQDTPGGESSPSERFLEPDY